MATTLISLLLMFFGFRVQSPIRRVNFIRSLKYKAVARAMCKRSGGRKRSSGKRRTSIKSKSAGKRKSAGKKKSFFTL